MKTDTMRRLQCLQATIQAQTTPCAWMLDENGIDLFTVSWEQTPSGDYQAQSFYHWQYHEDEHEMIIIKLAYNPDVHASRDALLTQARQLVDSYNQQRKQDAGTVSEVFSWHISQQAIMWDHGECPLISQITQAINSEPIKQSPYQHGQADTRMIGTWVSSTWIRPYTFTDKHEREWKKMLIIMPENTQLGETSVAGWAFDQFMTPKNQERKTMGKDVYVWFDKTKPVTLFHTTPTGKETMRVKPWDLVNTLRKANAIARKQREHDVEQANQIMTIIQQEYCEQVNHLAKKLHEYQTRGTYDPRKALHTVRRLVNKCLIYYEQTHINPGCMRENELTTPHSVRDIAAVSLLDQLVKQTICHDPHEQTFQQSAEDTSIRHSTIKHMTR